MQNIGRAMDAALGKLSEEASALTLSSKQREKDSKAMKALTSVATFYLPASLVATIFSSSLVQLIPATPSPSRPSHFVAAPQSWLPVVATLSLMIVTLISVRILENIYRYFR